MPEENSHSAPPIEAVTPQNMPVHMAYMRRDLDTLKHDFKEVAKTQTDLLTQIRDNTPSRKEFEEMREHIYAKADDNEFKKLEKFVTDNMVTKTDFEPVKKVVYGMMVLTLTAVMVAILSLVVIKA